MAVHVLLLILKILGIILACVVGLVLLVLLLILFVPLRYNADLAWHDTYDIRATASWGLHLIHINAGFREKKLRVLARLFGIRILKDRLPGKEDEEDPKSQDTGRHQTPQKSEALAAPGNKSSEEMEAIVEKTAPAGSEQDLSDGSAVFEKKETIDWDMTPDFVSERIPEYSDEDLDVYDITDLFEDETLLKEAISNSKKSKRAQKKKAKEALKQAVEELDPEEAAGKIAALLNSLQELLLKILNAVLQIYDKIEAAGIKAEQLKDKSNSILDKTDSILGFIKTDMFRIAFAKCKKEVFKILRSVLPRKFVIDLTYGLNDPAMTGKIYGAACVLSDYLPGTYRITPDFLTPCIDGELTLKGKIQLIKIVIPAIRILLKKEVRMCWKHWKKIK